jgi:DNA-binding transcriptional MerR regulator
MKKWVILFVAFLLMFVVASSSFVVAEDDCSELYWFDDDSTECGQKEFCGVYMYEGLMTFETEEECESEIGIGCESLYWFDADSTECGYQEFCGMFMYEGLRTFESEDECKGELGAGEDEEIEENVDEDDDGVDDDAEEEVRDFAHAKGVEMRFSQLEYSIERRILRMNAVIDYLSDSDYEVSELEDIVAEMDALEAEAAGVDYGLSKEELTELYIDIKTDARVLVGDFRMKVREIVSLTDEQKAELEERFDELEEETMGEIRKRIAEKRKEYMAIATEEILREMGVEDEEMVRKIRDGVMNSEGVRAALKRMAAEDEARLNEIRANLKAKDEARKADVEARIAEFKEGREERIEERVRARVEAVDRFRDRIDERIQSRIENRRIQ